MKTYALFEVEARMIEEPYDLVYRRLDCLEKDGDAESIYTDVRVLNNSTYTVIAQGDKVVAVLPSTWSVGDNYKVALVRENEE